MQVSLIMGDQFPFSFIITGNNFFVLKYNEKKMIMWKIMLLKCLILQRFPGIIANDNITLQLRKGEIHALLGENGAGKSTLMSVLSTISAEE